MAQKQKFISSPSGGQKSEIKVLAALVSSEASPWLVDGSLLPGSSLGLLCVCVCVCVLISSYKDTPQTGLPSPLRASFYLSYLFKDPASEWSHSELLRQHRNLEGRGHNAARSKYLLSACVPICTTELTHVPPQEAAPFPTRIVSILTLGPALECPLG